MLKTTQEPFSKNYILEYRYFEIWLKSKLSIRDGQKKKQGRAIRLILDA